MPSASESVRTVQFHLVRDWKGRSLEHLEIILWVQWPGVPRKYPKDGCDCATGWMVIEQSAKDLIERYPHIERSDHGGRFVCNCVGRIIE